MIWLLLLACGVGAFALSAPRAVTARSGPAATPVPFAHSRLAAGARGAPGLRRLEALPVAAQTVISSALGADDAAYAVRRTSLGLRMSASGLVAGFTRHGVGVSTAYGSATLSLLAIGRRGRLQRLAEVSPTGRANRVVYRDGLVSERFVNGPLGLEQVFTVNRRPAGAFGSLTLELGLGGDLSPVTVDGGRALVFRRAGGQGVLRYGGLRVTDARGQALAARLVLSHGRLLIQVAGRGAVYPLKVDPTFTEITDPGDLNGDGFGYSVAISGHTIVVGAASDATSEAAGIVYVFTTGSHGWTRVAQLNPPSPIGEGGEMGYSVAISGSTIAAGAPFTSPQGTQSGEVFVFTEPAGGWASEPTETPVATLTATDGAQLDELGYSVAVSGSTIVAGAPDLGYPGNEGAGDGAVYVFAEPAHGWASELLGDTPAAAEFSAGDGSELGTSVAMYTPSGSVDGTIVAGAPAYTSSHLASGAVEVYTGSGSSWTKAATLPGAGTDYSLGAAVAISAGTIVAGAPGAPDGGAAYVFTGGGASWSSGAAVSGPSGWTGPALGAAVAVSGNTLLIGDAQAASGDGAAFEVTEPGGGWTDESMSSSDELTPPGSAGAQNLGQALAISGALVVVGADGTPISSQPGHNAGAVFVNQSGVSEPPSLQITSPTNGSVTHSATATVTGTASDSLGLSSVTVDGSPVTVTAGAFSTSVALSRGANTITAVATGTDDETTTRHVTVTYTLPPPVIAGLRLTNPRFRVSSVHTPIMARVTVPFGTAFHFRLSVVGKMTITIEHSAKGLRDGKRCVAGTARLRKQHAKSCTRTVLNGKLIRTDEPKGADVVPFSGRIGSKALHPGRYQAIAVATDSGGGSKPATVKFTVVS